MIKGFIYFLICFSFLGAIHFLISQLFTSAIFSLQVVWSYVLMLLVSFVGNFLLHNTKKSEDKSSFANAFMTFTVIQMLAVLFYAAYLIYGDVELGKYIVYQLLILFFLALIVQSIYFVRLSNSANQQKKF